MRPLSYEKIIRGFNHCPFYISTWSPDDDHFKFKHVANLKKKNVFIIKNRCVYQAPLLYSYIYKI
jgi:hypothetical protein